MHKTRLGFPHKPLNPCTAPGERPAEPVNGCPGFRAEPGISGPVVVGIQGLDGRYSDGSSPTVNTDR